MSMRLRAVFEGICPNCGGRISDVRLLMGLHGREVEAPGEVGEVLSGMRALAEAAVEGTSIDAALERSLSTVDWAPLREAVTALIRGGNPGVSLDILRRYVESEIEAESREISLRLGIRTTAAFSAITVVAASVVTGSAPPGLIAPAAAAISLFLLAASMRRWIRLWRARA